MDTVSVDPGTQAAAEVRAAVAAVPLWYHTIDLPHGVCTPGWFDLRPIVDLMPWPDVRGRRCLDVGTYDGFLAFQLERRGAAEVVAVDIADHTQWDWPPRIRARGPEALAQIAGPEKGAGFRTAHAALSSNVERLELSVYDLSPERVGTFDVIVCGTLMLHLRDPLRATAAIRSVCSGYFMSTEEVRIALPLIASRRPLLELDGTSDLCQWSVPSPAAHVRMLEASGFEIERAGPRYSVPFGVAHPAPKLGSRLRQRTVTRLLGWGPGVAHHAALGRAA